MSLQNCFNSFAARLVMQHNLTGEAAEGLHLPLVFGDLFVRMASEPFSGIFLTYAPMTATALEEEDVTHVLFPTAHAHLIESLMPYVTQTWTEVYGHSMQLFTGREVEAWNVNTACLSGDYAYVLGDRYEPYVVLLKQHDLTFIEKWKLEP